MDTHLLALAGNINTSIGNYNNIQPNAMQFSLKRILDLQEHLQKLLLSPEFTSLFLSATSQWSADNKSLPGMTNAFISPLYPHACKLSEFRVSVSLHPTVLWRTYKRTQNNAVGLRGTSIYGCVILNLHLPLNTHHPPL